MIKDQANSKKQRMIKDQDNSKKQRSHFCCHVALQVVPRHRRCSSQEVPAAWSQASHRRTATVSRWLGASKLNWGVTWGRSTKKKRWIVVICLILLDVLVKIEHCWHEMTWGCVSHLSFFLITKATKATWVASVSADLVHKEVSP